MHPGTLLRPIHLRGNDGWLVPPKNKQGTSRLQPVIVTAYSLCGEIVRLLQEGFAGYPSEPFQKVELVHEMRRVVRREADADAAPI